MGKKGRFYETGRKEVVDICCFWRSGGRIAGAGYEMKRIALIVLAACVCFLAGCGQKAENSETFAMDTIIKQTVYGDASGSVVEINNASINMIEEKMSKTIPGSDVYTLNHAGGHETQVSEATYEVIEACVEAARATDGAYDPTAGGLVSLWGFGSGYEAVPGERMLESTLKLSGYENVTLGDNYTVSINNAQIDLGGAAKGYALDVLKDNMEEAGVESALITVGGSVYAVGKKSDGQKWIIGVRNPFGDESQLVCSITLDGECVSTSGAYERGFTENGKYYHHILDMETGYPVENGLVSVSVVDENGLKTDIYSTALFAMGLEKGLEFANGNGLAAMFINEDGEIYLTDGFGHDFKLRDNSFEVQ